MRQLFGLILALGVLALSASHSLADDSEAGQGGKGKKGNPEAVFKKIDINGDGKLSKDEFKTFIENAGKGKLKNKPGLIDKLFARLDANSDGFLSLDEFKKLREIRKKVAGQKGNKNPNNENSD